MRPALLALPALALALSACAPASSAGAPGPRSFATDVAATATIRQTPSQLAALLGDPVPVNDLWALAARLKLHRLTPIRRIVNSRSPNFPVGHVDRFWVLNNATDVYSRVSARIVCETAHLYLYVDQSVKASRNVACVAARFFENHIYPTDRALYGAEWRPGVDDDPHVTLFYGHTPGVAGYFSGEDEYPTSVNRFSNQREMMFISSEAIPLGGAPFDQTVAHEFQHMIHWHMHPQDEAWDNEGASVLAQVVNGFGSDGLEYAYQSDPVQLDSWTDGNSSPDYGAGYLWWDYLYERFGASFIRAMMADSGDSGLALATRVLRQRAHLSLRTVFGDWIVANLLNDRRAGVMYGYRDTNMRIAPAVTLSERSPTYHAAVHPYAPLYVGVSPSAHAFRLHLTGAPTIPVIAAQSSSPFWYSNRCDFCDTSMTRVLNLQHARNPVLTFQTWFDIEQSYDYGYVEVSTDGGKTWSSLSTPVSSRKNPNGGNYGFGITGSSGKLAGNHGGWVPIRVSLNRYAGRRIELRFEYVTDDEYNGQSWAIKNVAIPSAGFTDRVGDAAWKLRGFVPVARNSLPLSWSIREVRYGHGAPSVSWEHVDGSGRATVSIPSSSSARRVVLAIFGQAPKTTLTAHVGISAAP